MVNLRCVEEPTVTIDSDAPLPGVKQPRRLGRYVLEDRLDAGGMGIVYRARDEVLDRPVALKILRAELLKANPMLVKRFVREATLAARLDHPNVVRVFELGIDQSEPFIAMELVDGLNLKEWLQVKHRSFAQILDVFTAAGRGIAAAHASGVVHRDIKPANILVAGERVVVADFGVARLIHHATGILPSAQLTGKGGAIGTPKYMSPEQRDGDDCSARSDQYSFCAALWEALFGECPASDPGRPASNPLDAPASLIASLRRGLVEGARGRFSDMDALLSALATARPGTARRPVWPMIAMTVAATALITSALFLFVFDRGGADRATSTEQPVSRKSARPERTTAGGADPVAVAEFEARLDRFVTQVHKRMRAEHTVRMFKLVTEAAALRSPAVLTRSLAVSGEFMLDAGEHQRAYRSFSELILRASQAKMDLMVARGWLGKLDAALLDSDLQQALAVRAPLRIAIARAGEPVALRVRANARFGELYRRLGRARQADDALRTGLKLAEGEPAKQSPAVAKLLTQLGALVMTGEPKRAEPLFDRAKAIWRKVGGSVRGLIGTLLLEGQMHDLRKQHARARQTYERAWKLARSRLVEPHVIAGRAIEHQARSFLLEGRWAEAKRLFARALTEYRSHGLKTEHSLVTSAIARAGLNHVGAGDARTALDTCGARAKDLFARGIRNRGAARLRYCVGIAQAALGKNVEAVRSLDAARHAHMARRMRTSELVAVELSLAKLLWDTKRDRDRARGLASRARTRGTPAQQKLAVELISVWKRQ